MKVLKNKFFYYFLLFLNGIVAIGAFIMAKSTVFPDAKSYEMMAQSIGHGKFSSWYFLPFYMPETLRMWGYPFFIYVITLICRSEFSVKLVQLVLYFCTVFLTLGIIKHRNGNIRYRNLFLLLLLPNIQIAYYAGLIASESLATFLTVLFIYIYFTKELNWKSATLLAIVAFADFQTRPIFILFPLLLFAYELFFCFNKTRLKNLILYLSIYSILFLPFGYWNLKNHHIFKITSLEGGAGPAQIGYWGFMLPNQYHCPYYIGQIVIDDYFQPTFFDSIQREKFITDYTNEWHEIDKQLAKYNSPEDSARMMIMEKSNPGIWMVYNGSYTNAREKLIWQYLAKDIRANPMYYLKTRIYTFCRDWYTGINIKTLEEAHSKSQILKAIYPFLVTFITIFIGLLFITLSFIIKKIKWEEYGSVYLLIMYFGIINIPFSIQSRYSIPVQILIIALLAIAILSFKNFKNSFKQEEMNL